MKAGAQWPTVDRSVAHDLAKDIAEAPVHPDETLYERRMQALSLRNAGMTITDISRTHNVSTATTRNDIEWAKREVMSTSLEDIIATQRAVIHDLRKAAYPAAMNPKDNESQMRAQKQIIDGLVHEAKLVGAFAPMRVIGAPSDTEFAERFVQLISTIKPETLKELTRGHFAAHPDLDARRQDQSGDADPDQQPVDADVVDLPEPSTVVRYAPDTGEGTPVGGPPHAEPEPPGDDWSNIG